ncbi:MAG: S8 family serine peptidase [Pseudomonadota bacterium]
MMRKTALVLAALGVGSVGMLGSHVITGADPATAQDRAGTLKRPAATPTARATRANPRDLPDADKVDDPSGPSQSDIDEAIEAATGEPPKEEPVTEIKTEGGQEAQEEPESAPDTRPIIMRNADLPLYRADELLLFLEGDRDAASISGITVLSREAVPAVQVTMVHARITSGESVEDALARLKGKSGIAWAQPNYIYQLLGNSRNQGLAMHGLDEAATLLPQGLPAVPSGATIAMIDSPVDLAHPSLADARISQKGRFASAPPSPHGTAISEILVGTGDFPGIIAGAQLLSIPAFTPVDTDDWHKPSISTSKLLVEAFEVAHQADPDVLNLSFGSPTSNDPAIGRMVELLFDSGVCLAAAAGNSADDPVMFPATLSSTIAVAAVDASERIYRHGSRGAAIDIASWGVAINAAVPGGRRSVTGTSFAAPVVAGAMLRMPMCSQYGRPQSLRDALSQDAKDLGDPGKDEVFGMGLLRFGDALATQKGDPGPESGSIWPWIAGGIGALLVILLLAFRRRKPAEQA